MSERRFFCAHETELGYTTPEKAQAWIDQTQTKEDEWRVVEVMPDRVTAKLIESAYDNDVAAAYKRGVAAEQARVRIKLIQLLEL